DRGRRGEAAQGHTARRCAEGARDRSRGVRALPPSRPARTAVHSRAVPAVRRALPQSAGDRSALRPGVVRSGSQLRQRDGPRPSARQGRIRPSPRGGREGACDRSGLRTGPCSARLDRDVRRQRPCRCRAAHGALAELEEETSEIYKMIGLPLAYHALGRKADSDAALAALIAKYEKDGPSNIASVYAYRGEADKAFEWLDKAVEFGDGGLGEIVTDNLFEKNHADPRWLAFLRKIGKAPEQLAKVEFKVTLPQ